MNETDTHMKIHENRWKWFKRTWKWGTRNDYPSPSHELRSRDTLGEGIVRGYSYSLECRAFYLHNRMMLCCEKSNLYLYGWKNCWIEDPARIGIYMTSLKSQLFMCEKERQKLVPFLLYVSLLEYDHTYANCSFNVTYLSPMIYKLCPCCVVLMCVAPCALRVGAQPPELHPACTSSSLLGHNNRKGQECG